MSVESGMCSPSLCWSKVFKQGNHYSKNYERVLPKVISEEFIALAPLCNKVPIGCNGTPEIHPENCSFSFDGHHPYLIHSSFDQPHHHPPNSIQIHLAILPQYTFWTHGQTNRHRPTNGISERSIPVAFMLY